MVRNPVRSASAGAFVAAVVLAAITVFSVSPAAAVPLPAPSPSPTVTSVTYEAGLYCQPETCPSLDGFICAGGSDCGLWFLRHGCTDCPQLVVDYYLRVNTTARVPEVHTGRIVFAAGRIATVLVFRPSAPVRSIDLQLAVGGVVVHRQTIT